MKFIVLIGRILFAAIFIMSAPQHFTQGDISYAQAAGVPMPNLLVPLSGVIALIGGLSIALGFRARMGAWLLVIFLIPVSLYMHKFWGLSDPGQQQMQMIHFMKNVSMLGAALMIAYHGSGPASVDAALVKREGETTSAKMK